MPYRSGVAIVALGGSHGAAGVWSSLVHVCFVATRRGRRGAIRIFKVCGDTRVRFRWSDPHSSQSARL